MKKQYITDDGEVFSTEAEATAHEAHLARVKANREKLAAEQQGRKEDIKADYKALMKKIEQYNTDYGELFTYARIEQAPAIMVRDLFKLADLLTWQ